MVGTNESLADKAEALRDTAADKAKEFGDQASSTVKEWGNAASSAANDASAKASNAKDTAAAIAADLKSHASDRVEDAKGFVSSMANDAKSKISDIIDQQKAASSQTLAGLSKAAHSAAGDFDTSNPHVARMVRNAATTVEQIADDVRGGSLNDVVSSVTSFAKKQPAMFVVGSLFAGFVLARFLGGSSDEADRKG